MCDFVTFEIAKKLKEKEFPQSPDYFNHSSYYEWDGLRKIHPLYNVNIWYDNINKKNLYFAPTISQVLKWLRKEKKISIEAAIHCSLKWMCNIYSFSDGITDCTQYNNDGVYDSIFILYDSYEEAALAGIEYILDEII